MLAVTRVVGEPAEVVIEAVDAFQAQASGTGVSVVADIKAPMPPCSFDGARILQVLSNLLSNAIKFTPPQGTVVVTLEHVDDEVVCRVSDTGAGIPDDKLEMIFDRFVQLTKNDRRGVGLGLFISKCIVQGHGGRMWAENRVGTGGVCASRCRSMWPLLPKQRRPRSRTCLSSVTRHAHHWCQAPTGLFLLGFETGAFGREMQLLRVVHPDDRARVEELVMEARLRGSYEAEYRVIRPDGSVRWITDRGRVVSDGDADRMVGIARDVSAEHQAADERERLLRSEAAARLEAERESRLKDEFLATLSHELRTPMNAVLGWLSILESGKPVRDIDSALAVVRRNAQLQARLIDDLLDMNRLMTGNISLERAAVDIGALAQATMQSMQLMAQDKGVQLLAVVDSDSGRVSADPRRLQQVLWNIVHNAVKFTGSGGRVTMRVQRQGDAIQIAVQDNGKGIAPHFLPHVFERFRQQDATPIREFFGMGLGLAIARQLIELHGGTITAASDGEDRGSVFTLTLPVSAIDGMPERQTVARSLTADRLIS